MTERGKGRQGPDDNLLTKKEAADHLGVPLQAINTLVRKKALEAIRIKGKSYFYLSDVNNAARIVSSGITLVKANAMAMQAISRVTNLERRMTDMLYALGVENRFEPLNEELVIRRHQRVLLQLERPIKDLTAAQVREWARLYFSLDEGFFLFAMTVLGTKEPWLPFIKLGIALLLERQTEDLELATAFEYLAAAVRSARCAAYLVCRGRYGEAKANLAFPDTKDASAALSILALIQDAEQRRHA